MERVRLEHGRRVIPNTFGRLFYFGNIHFGHATFISGTARFEKQLLLTIDYKPSQSYNILEMTIGSFDGFGKKTI